MILIEMMKKIGLFKYVHFLDKSQIVILNLRRIRKIAGEKKSINTYRKSVPTQMETFYSGGALVRDPIVF